MIKTTSHCISWKSIGKFPSRPSSIADLISITSHDKPMYNEPGRAKIKMMNILLIFYSVQIKSKQRAIRTTKPIS